MQAVRHTKMFRLNKRLDQYNIFATHLYQPCAIVFNYKYIYIEYTVEILSKC